MGKIQKIREQKKMEAEQELQERRQRAKTIIIGVTAGLTVLFLLIFGVTKFLNWRVSQGNSATKDLVPTVSNQPDNLFPSVVPSTGETNTIIAKTAIIKTDKGDIKLELYPEAAPKTVANFVALADKGFYSDLTFHRVVSGFMIQGGDPKGDGTGGPGYTFADEINPWSLGLSEETIKSYQAQGYQYDKSLTSHKMEVGALAMANSGANTNGSQFFIVTTQAQPHLDGKHTVFGQVIEGLDVVRKIQQGDIIKEIKIAK